MMQGTANFCGPERMRRTFAQALRCLLAGLLAFAMAATAQAAPAYQAAGGAANGAGSVSPAWPVHAIGDIALLFVESTGGDAVSLSSNAAGFVAVAGSPQATGSGTNGTQINVYWARATSTSMAAPTVAHTGDHLYAQIITYRGVVTSGNPWDVTVGGVKAAASTSVTVIGVTTTVPDTLIVQAVARDDDASGAEFSAEANAGLTGIAERSDAGTTSGNGGGFAVWDGVKATAGATGNTSATVVSSINAFLTIALKPQPPTVSSINLANFNPTSPGSSVSWTVTFSKSVSGVDAGDFALVPGGGVGGASITSVTGGGATWTVTANTGAGGGTLGLNLVDNDSIVDAGGTPLGGAGAGNGNFTGQIYNVFACTQPPNTAGVTLTCVCDIFGRASLNPSTIFSGTWAVSSSDGLGISPYINATTGLLRLTENTGNNAKAATVPSIFPAAGNYISVEFGHYAYNGSNPGADGIAVTLSDYSVPAVPGGFGGSLGYAQRNDGVLPPGFAGGWVGVALDEWGNYQNPTEGRILGTGFIVESVGVRGPGSGANGYRWMGGTASNPGGLSIDNHAATAPAPGYLYQVIVDARNYSTGTINVSVNRDSTTRDGSSYASLFGPFNSYTEANYALGQGWISKLVPDYWQISFTGSTGGANNIHEIGSLRICAQTVYPPTGGTASGFSAIDEAYPGAPTVPAYPNFQTGHIYMKLTGVSFKLWVAALTGSGISTGYSATTNKYVAVKLVDNSDNACGPDTARTCNSTCTNKTTVEAGATQIAAFPKLSSTGVASPSPTFTLNSSWKNLIAVMKECTDSTCTSFTATAPACSVDSFSVRPTGISSVVSSNATNAGTSGTPVFKAGSDNFSLTATTTGIAGNPSGYTGVLKVNSSAIQAVGPATVAGAVAGTFPAATSGTPTSTATATTLTYSEVGGFQLPGYNPATDTSSPRGVFDGVATATECTAPGLTTAQCDTLRAATWTGLDSVTTKGDCVLDSYANTKDANGKYGCNFGLMTTTATIGRFKPDHFALTPSGAGGPVLTNRTDVLACADPATTGTVGAGSTALTVASGAGFVSGDTVVVTGAGANGIDLVTTAIVAGVSFTLAAPATTAVTNTAVRKLGFTYMGERFGLGFTLTAQNGSGATTKNYTTASGLAKLLPATPAQFGFGAVSGTMDLSSRIDTSYGSAGTWVAGVANFTSTIAINRAATPDGAYDITRIGIAPNDGDPTPNTGVQLQSTALNLDVDNNASNDHASVGTTGLRFGRLRLNNASGSELLALPVTMTLQYYNVASGGFVTNTADTCTTFNAGDIALVFPVDPKNNLSACESSAALTGGSPSSLKLSAPGSGNNGWVDLRVNLGAVASGSSCVVGVSGAASTANKPYLQGAWSAGSTYTQDPTCRVRFGTYKNANEFIFIRENY